MSTLSQTVSMLDLIFRWSDSQPSWLEVCASCARYRSSRCAHDKLQSAVRNGRFGRREDERGWSTAWRWPAASEEVSWGPELTLSKDSSSLSKAQQEESKEESWSRWWHRRIASPIDSSIDGWVPASSKGAALLEEPRSSYEAAITSTTAQGFEKRVWQSAGAAMGDIFDGCRNEN